MLKAESEQFVPVCAEDVFLFGTFRFLRLRHALFSLGGRNWPGSLLRKPHDAQQFEELEVATKRHKRRIQIRLLCFLCLFVAHDSVVCLPA